MEQEEVVHLRVFDEETGDVVYEGNVSTDVSPDDLVWLGCFVVRGLSTIRKKASKERLTTLKGLQSNTELVAASDWHDVDFSGVLFMESHDDYDGGVLRKSTHVPILCQCVMMTVCQ